MARDRREDRYDQKLEKKQMAERALRHRSTEDVEAEEDAISKAKAEREKDPEKYQLKADQAVGRNDPCPCGSGKKYKKCCALKE